jgi:TonB-linked SusC/RagA family outer membrane protein
MKHKQLSFVSIRCRVYAKAITSLAFASVAILATAKPVATESTSVQTIMQTKITVQGVVKDAHGDPIVGATVTEKGNSKNGTITDIDGHYSISLPRGKMVDVTYVGFKTLSFTASSTKHDIVLEEDLTDLNEVVVIGYGTQKKADVTSSVASVKAKDFNTGSVIDAGQLVQGKVAGLSISLPSGDPNGSTTVMLRGTSSLMGSSTPLVLVDGVPGSLSTVAPEEIESIDVLKDGSATAIYGTRGTNGVIIITTKSGSRESAPSIEYNGYLSTSYQAKKADFLNADELRSRLAEGWSPSGADDKDYGASVDWLKEVSRTALSHNHDLTFRGGSKNVSYIASLNYQNRQGTLKKTNGKNIRANLELTHRMFNDKLTTTIMLIASELKYPYGVSNGTVYRDACIQNPTQPIYDENGKYVERNVYFYDNPVSLQNENIGSARNRNIRFTGTMVYRPFEDLMLKGSVTRKGQNSMNGYYQTKEHPSTTENGLNGYAYRYSSDYIYNNVELTADWHHQFGKNNIEAIAGYSYEDNRTEYFSESNRNFPTDAYTYNLMEAGKGIAQGTATLSSYKYETKLIGFFGRVTYNYDDRYLAMFSIRHEGSSKFGEDHKWGNFPGVSLGWRMNNEKFMKDIKWIDNLKLRAGFGITGIDINDPYQSLASYGYSDYFLYNNEWVKILNPTRNANPDLRWEKKYEYNLGVDYEFFGGRLGGSIDLYLRDTKDALWNYSVPVPPYQYSTIMANVGKIRNKGIEILINAIPVKTKDFEWNLNFSYSHNSNEIRSISNDQFSMSTDWFTTGYTGEPIQTETHRVKVGDPIGNFFGLKSVGVNEDGKWVVERLARDDEGNLTGEKYYDLAENATTEDRQVLGNGVPKHFVNFNNTLTYKGWDMSINMRGQFGAKILNFQEMFYANPTIQYNVLNSAFDEHPVVSISSDQKSITYIGKIARLNDSQRFVSEYVESGDFWKIDNVTLGYSFNVKNIKWIQRLRIYASCLNLATITGYKGLDPEVDITGLTPGTDDRDKYPTTRSFTFGLNVTF